MHKLAWHVIHRRDSVHMDLLLATRKLVFGPETAYWEACGFTWTYYALFGN